MKNPTLNDVAQWAGVSYATADRVVNRRGNVAEKSVHKVRKAVAALGYIRNVSAAKLSKNSPLKLAFVLPLRTHTFFGRMHKQLDRVRPHLRTAQVLCDIIEFEAFEPGALRAALTGLSGQGYNGVAFVGQGAGEASVALKALRKEGAKTVSLVSDSAIESRDFYIGIDNVKAGRTAARLVGVAHRGMGGKVIVTVGSIDQRDHLDRVEGFRAVMDAEFPNIELTDIIETKDQPILMHSSLRRQLDDNSGTTALYNAGAGTEGAVDVLRTLDLPAPLICVVHELSGNTREALEDGVIDFAIDQRPEIEVNRAVALLQAVVDELPPPPAPELIPAIYVRDNLPIEHS